MLTVVNGTQPRCQGTPHGSKRLRMDGKITRCLLIEVLICWRLEDEKLKSSGCLGAYW